MSFIDYFDQVQIINMASRIDRRKETRAEFTRYHLPTDTEQVSFFQAFTPSTPAGFPNNGARGCFLSHLAILKNAESINANNVLVLEDDVAFSKHINELGQLAVNQLAEMDWDIAYFGHKRGSDEAQTCWKKVDAEMLQSHFYAVNGKTLNRMIRCFEAILSRPPGHPDGGPMHYDGAINTFVMQNSDINAVYFSKNLGYQRPSKTNIQTTSVLDASPILKPTADIYRRAKRILLRATQ